MFAAVTAPLRSFYHSPFEVVEPLEEKWLPKQRSPSDDGFSGLLKVLKHSQLKPKLIPHMRAIASLTLDKVVYTTKCRKIAAEIDEMVAICNKEDNLQEEDNLIQIRNELLRLSQKLSGTYYIDEEKSFYIDDGKTLPKKPLKLVNTSIEAHNRREVWGHDRIVKKLAKEFASAQKQLEEKDNKRWEIAFEKVKKEHGIEEKTAVAQTLPKKCVKPLGDVRVGHAQGARDSMQDAHMATVINVESEQFLSYAVMDGHGGIICADYIKNLLSDLLKISMQRVLEKKPTREYAEDCFFNIFKLAPVRLGKMFRDAYPNNRAGTTLVSAIIHANNAWVLNVGDSRAIISANGQAIALSEDATPVVLDEDDDLELHKYRRGILKRGGDRVYFDVHRKVKWEDGAMARAIGHAESNAPGQFNASGVNPRPKIIKFPLKTLMEGHNLMIIASDGFWFYVSCNQAARAAYELALAGKTTAQIALLLTKVALLAGGQDNITVLVLDLDTLPPAISNLS